MELPSSVNIQEISIHGIYTDAEFEKCRVALRNLLNYRKNLKVQMKRYFSMDYEILIEGLKKTPKYQDTAIMLYKNSTSPLIIVNQKYVIHPRHLYAMMFNQYEYEDNSPLFLYKRLAVTEYAKYFATNKQYEYVYMDFLINFERHSIPQRVVFELDVQVAPKTCKNFIELVKGTHTTPEGKQLQYKGTTIHKVWNNGFIQGGDVDHLNGKGGQSIYGKYFEDENYVLKHDKTGLLGMAGNGTKHTNNSQFYVTLLPLPHYDNKFVVFGRVVEGFRVIKLINKLAITGTKPKYEVKIHDCGMFTYNTKKAQMKKTHRRFGF